MPSLQMIGAALYAMRKTFGVFKTQQVSLQCRQGLAVGPPLRPLGLGR